MHFSPDNENVCFKDNDNYHDLIVDVLLTLGLQVVFFEFCKIDG